jgi:hypothetical protein
MQNQGLPASRQIVVTPTKSDNYRPVFKEKFVSLYEDIFALRSPLQTAKDQGIQGRVAIGRFWDELLLLKVGIVVGLNIRVIGLSFVVLMRIFLSPQLWKVGGYIGC